MEKNTVVPKIHYAWIVLIGCALCSAAGLGYQIASMGQFMAAVRSDLNVAMTTITLPYVTTVAIITIFIMPFVGKILKKNFNGTMIIAGLCFFGGWMGMSFAREITHFYICAIFIGLGSPFVQLVSYAILANNWFYKKRGLAMGIYSTCIGLYGIILGPVIASVIKNQGWRVAHFWFPMVSLIVFLICVIFLLRFSPEKKGLKPYGWEETSGEDKSEAVSLPGVPASKAIKTRAFVAVIVIIGLMGFQGGFTPQLVAFTRSVGLSIMFGGIMTSAMQLSDTGGKFLLGPLSDKFGVKRIFLTIMVLTIGGFLCLAFSGGNPTFIIIGAFLYGLHQGAVGVLRPLIPSEAFGRKDYSTILSYAQTVVQIVTIFSSLSIAYVFDRTGSYQLTFIFGACVALTVAVFTVKMYAWKTKLVFEP